MILSIQPIAGLANRMRVIDSALALSDDFKIDIKIFWRKSPACNCAFDKLFEIPEKTEIIENYSLIRDGGKVDLIFNKWKIFYNTFFIKEYVYSIYYQNILNLKKSNFDFREILKYESVFIQGFIDFYHNSKSHSYLKPSNSIAQIVKEICDGMFVTNTIGIHIRRTDNKWSIQNSPDILFYNKIDKELSVNSDTKFFLATDSRSTENDFISKYGDKIIVLEKEFNRNTEEGIISAYIDLLCLSKTSRIYGSFHSSFSEIAAEIGKIEICILKNE
jgi:hypothetical protein